MQLRQTIGSPRLCWGRPPHLGGGGDKIRERGEPTWFSGEGRTELGERDRESESGRKGSAAAAHGDGSGSRRRRGWRWCFCFFRRV
ncbi:hypothetical protein HanXRQr2_Chr11g0491331 [Helianthus annuus]|uniref:Uncharacterized protein n=1 Tax=Helianthus annuus TaxID=4232 RepID=A0A9K3HPQ4_HELAN|nr:hypothetical protein HanXRQr2_Chr11g0491331 [Helianthus annuus]KAJ0875213.1 hypothetical protein HanPSC8_Chr11g0473521 [Helianthus annuus]